MTKRIAIIDDEPDILELVSLHLKKAGFRTNEFQDANGFFLHYKTNQPPDLLILDLMLPDADGFEICKVIRDDEKLSSLSVIMLTARGDEIDKVVGLEVGADDYVTKPFSPKELVARVKAVLRRHAKQDSQESKKIYIKDVMIIDLEKFEVSVEGNKVDLTTTEFKILELLCSKKGWLFSRNKILDHIWGSEKAVLDRTVDVHVKNLREKLGMAAVFIKNVRGVGYKLEE
ncbi:MAG: two-component system response regulator [Candidatus Margulisiibacteriota bacterium]|nr:MAG: two-component system response regulator [Candidatus Margulisbacteria bacterium GWD2_39_127]OGI01136.1 MAG: two-component system response regulator [Candidatus Margulisbacteria bacterium GWF2_38_17]OGI10546.1 MAG: two-component system response regulator [Candidatus Margulisbacteria bacterium GWE2_39_32]PZM78846.1 MAG: two-component system response regulator [Candidatus Margulisiibacteriota bacterium]HAR64574.1 two-component system response regulator [Candidatus Margulisiibacteriota bacte